MRQLPKTGEIYRHFKGNCYRIVTLAKHTETRETLVVYQALYGDNEVYARELSMFLGPVDREKYPDATQKMRFELLDERSAATAKEQNENRQCPENVNESENKQEVEKEQRIQIDPMVMAYLDAGSSKERLEILKSVKDRLTDEMIDTMAVAIDVEVGPGDIIERYEELKFCLATRERFECRRLR